MASRFEKAIVTETRQLDEFWHRDKAKSERQSASEPESNFPLS